MWSIQKKSIREHDLRVVQDYLLEIDSHLDKGDGLPDDLPNHAKTFHDIGYKHASKISKLDWFLVSDGLLDLFPNLEHDRKVLQDYLLEIDSHLDKGYGLHNDLPNRAKTFHDIVVIDRKIYVDMAQKAKVKWAIKGDENSKFFYGIVNKKRRQQAIKGILEDGEWIDNPDRRSKHFCLKLISKRHLIGLDEIILMNPCFNVNVLMMMLHWFFLLSGLKVNVHKSILYGLGVYYSDIQSMANSFGCLVNNLLFTYLGVKVAANMARIKSWNEVIQKVTIKLSKWSHISFKMDSLSDPDLVTRISKLDIRDPLHLHPNDTTALTIVSIKLKGTKNYQVWSCAMLLALEGKNKIDFIDGSCKRSNTNEVLGKQWDRYDATIEIPKYVCNTSKGFKKHNQLLKLMQFLMGLDDSYMKIRSTILSREVLPDMRSAYATISSKESHKVAAGSIAGSSQRNQASAFMSNVPNSQNFQRSNQNFSTRPSRPNSLNNNRQVNLEYCVTLIYVHKLVKENKVIVVFDENKCYFLNQDLNLKNVLRIGKQREGLYYYNDKVRVIVAAFSMSGSNINTADFPVDSANDVDSSDNLVATQNEEVATLEENVFFEGNLDQDPSSSQDVQNVRREPKTYFEAFKYSHWTDDMNQEMDAFLEMVLGNWLNYLKVEKPLEVNRSIRSISVITKYLMNISKRRAFWSLNEDILKITVLTTNTMYPSRKIRRIRAGTHQRPQRKKDQYSISRRPICRIGDIVCVVKNVKVDYENQIADILTKGLDTVQHLELVKRLGMYDVYQAPRQWNAKLTSTLIKNGFSQSKSDYYLYTKSDKGVFLALLVYVDDIIITGNSISEIQKFKVYLKSMFMIKDLGKLKYFLRIEVIDTDKDILNKGLDTVQHLELVKRLGMYDVYQSKREKVELALMCQYGLVTLFGEITISLKIISLTSKNDVDVFFAFGFDYKIATFEKTVRFQALIQKGYFNHLNTDSEFNKNKENPTMEMKVLLVAKTEIIIQECNKPLHSGELRAQALHMRPLADMKRLDVSYWSGHIQIRSIKEDALDDTSFSIPDSGGNVKSVLIDWRLDVSYWSGHIQIRSIKEDALEDTSLSIPG
nr:ribonuclease H-like domain-containing protein [Tanacetum cinerariifolium]